MRTAVLTVVLTLVLTAVLTLVLPAVLTPVLPAVLTPVLPAVLTPVLPAVLTVVLVAMLGAVLRMVLNGSGVRRIRDLIRPCSRGCCTSAVRVTWACVGGLGGTRPARPGGLMGGVYSHRHLHVWRVLDDIRRQTWALSSGPAFGAHPWLQTQLRRSAHSACANVAEGFARYRPREFARFLDIARASLLELTEHLYAPLDPAPPAEPVARILRQAAHADRALASLIRYLRTPQPHVPRRAPPSEPPSAPP